MVLWAFSVWLENLCGYPSILKIPQKKDTPKNFENLCGYPSKFGSRVPGFAKIVEGWNPVVCSGQKSTLTLSMHMYRLCYKSKQTKVMRYLACK